MSLRTHRAVGKWQSVYDCYVMAVIGIVAGIGGIVGAVRWTDSDPRFAVCLAVIGGMFLGLSMAFRGMGHYRQFWNDHFGRDVYAE